MYRVNYIYPVPGERSDPREKKKYLVIAQSEEEANKKAEEYFDAYILSQGLRLKKEDIRTFITPIESIPIDFPQLSLGEDRQFSLSARVSDSGDRLEIIVNKK